jgi:hypothetical protein
MLEIGASGSVGGEGGNILAYPANVGIIRSPVRASILPDPLASTGSEPALRATGTPNARAGRGPLPFRSATAPQAQWRTQT